MTGKADLTMEAGKVNAVRSKVKWHGYEVVPCNCMHVELYALQDYARLTWSSCSALPCVGPYVKKAPFQSLWWKKHTSATVHDVEVADDSSLETVLVATVEH
jgi:hypothetical protein